MRPMTVKYQTKGELLSEQMYADTTDGQEFGANPHQPKDVFYKAGVRDLERRAILQLQ